MLLYRKRQKGNESGNNQSVSDKVAGKLAGCVIKLQELFAKKMNRIFMKTDLKRLKLVLIFFCVCTGGYSIYLVANSIIIPEKNRKSFEVKQVNVPKHFNKNGDEEIIPEASVDEVTYQQIKQFRNYMDSLKENG